MLRWTGNANLNLEVAVDIGNPFTILTTTGFVEKEFLYPGYGYQDSRSGGHVPFDNLGGPHGGEEFAYWAGPFPNGIYGFAAQSISGVATSATLDVYEDGKRLEMFTLQPNNSGLNYKSSQFTHIIQPGQNFAAIVDIPEIPLLLKNTATDPAGDPNPGINPPGSSVKSAGIKSSVVSAAPSAGAKSGR